MSLEDTLFTAFESYYDAKLNLDSDGLRDHPRKTYERWMEDSVKDIKNAVLMEVQSGWTTLDSLKENISDLFQKFPKLAEFYEEYMDESISDVRKVFYVIYAQQLDLVVSNKDRLPYLAIDGIEKSYEMAKSALREIDGEDTITMVNADIGNGQERIADDEFVYGVFYKTLLAHIKEDDLPSLGDVSKMELASDSFENNILLKRKNLVRYAEKANLDEEKTEELNEIFETYDSAIRTARSDAKTIKKIKGKRNSLYGSMNQLVDAMINFPNVKCFNGYFEKMQELGKKYAAHCSNYSKVLGMNENGNNSNGVFQNQNTIVFVDKMSAINKEWKKFIDRIKSNPSTDFLLFNYLHN
ncbi:hypothetical protein HOC35_06370 [Candidatus Woesearchaeota archaeon]|jgi:hypothetical protein|nr:hypothetical protein [Candidatus Woesearchaeota archaeon]